MNLSRLFSPVSGVCTLGLAAVLLCGCATPPAGPAAPPPAAPMQNAVLPAANNLFGKADLTGAAASRGGAKVFPLVIDPLIDGNTGYQSQATQAMEQQVVKLLQSQYPSFQVKPFTTANLAEKPLLFIGTFTAVEIGRASCRERVS
jgi:hypothetical protein